MASNLAFQSRNVLSKKYMVESSLDSLEEGDKQQPLDEINLFACITIAAMVLMVSRSPSKQRVVWHGDREESLNEAQRTHFRVERVALGTGSNSCQRDWAVAERRLFF
jgi:hypothetical protein